MGYPLYSSNMADDYSRQGQGDWGNGGFYNNFGGGQGYV